MGAAPPLFVVNLDRSPERWARISAEAAALGADLRRVPGVDGKAVPRAEWIDVDEAAFGARHGRTILPGEYGCWRSHLRALEALEASGAPFGIILEDDVALSAEGLAGAQALADSGFPFDAVKLMSNRVKGFLPKFSAAGHDAGLTLHGPQGAASAYLVSHEGAGRLRKRLAAMTLPYDVALERWWDGGGPVYVVRKNLFGFGALSAQSSIGESPLYRATKFPKWRRIPAYAFRARDVLRRVWSAVTDSPQG